MYHMHGSLCRACVLIKMSFKIFRDLLFFYIEININTQKLRLSLQSLDFSLQSRSFGALKRMFRTYSETSIVWTDLGCIVRRNMLIVR